LKINRLALQMRRAPNGMGFAYGIRRPAFVMGVGQRDKGLAEGFT